MVKIFRTMMIKILSKTVLLIIVITFFACNKNKVVDPFIKDNSIKDNPTVVWLRNHDNYRNNKSYFNVFYKYYNTQIAQNKYIEAAYILDLVSTKLAFYYDFNKPFLTTVQEFDLKYRSKVPVLKTTFVDAYLSNYFYDLGNFKKSADYQKKIAFLEPTDYYSSSKIGRANYELSYIYYGMGEQNLSLQANHRAEKVYSKINFFNQWF